ncbi:MAG: lumazine-binding family protein [Massilia sp.]|jgi:hypothetical protein|nr:lumazine-binding family protein [Gemmatimonadales bacterium]MDB5910838.1 lumazine-binding family protein [Massilia sp.]
MDANALHDAVRELQDREQIREVLARYSRGIDRLDEDLIRSVYHPDAYDDHGPFKGGPEEFIAWIVPFLRAEYTTSSHHMTTQSITLDGDAATVETYAIVVQDKIRDGVRLQSTAHSRYSDRMERRNGEWRIAHRIVITDSAGTTPVPVWSGTTQLESLTAGRRDRTDPSYRESART